LRIAHACTWPFLCAVLISGLAAASAASQEPARPAPVKPAARPALSSSSDKKTVLVPAGSFLMGSPKGTEIAVVEKPEHTVRLEAFRIDRYEVTNEEYGRFLRAIKEVHPPTCSPLEAPGKDHTPDAKTWTDPEWNAPDKPVVSVDWFDAYAYCAWAGGRLPTEAEWEKAARGTDGRTYPWGNEFTPGVLLGNFADESAKKANPDWVILGNYDDGFVHTAPVGSFPDGKSPYGAEDMAGNVWEWVADWFASTTYSTPNQVDPTGPENGEARVLRGGSFDSHPNLIRTAARHRHWPTYRAPAYGFRCVRDVPHK